MLFFSTTLLLTIIFSFLPERFLKPNIPKLTIHNILLQSVLVTVLFLAVTLIVQRSIFSALAVSIFLIILTAVSNAKYQTLREPMVFSDIAMFSQAFTHPRLYFPFLGFAPVIITPIVIIGLIYAVLTLEPSMAITWQRITFTVVAIIICFFLARIVALKLNLVQKPASDNAEYGLLNSLFAYAMQARTDKHQQQIKQTLLASPFAENNHKIESKKTPPPVFNDFQNNSSHNITVIQSESFFDARRLHPSIRESVLKNYDLCKSESFQYGKLNVPAWGANTMRTEFSFLTGLKYEDMGFYRYYPYQYLHKMPVVSLAKLLQTQGYHCVCIHPHPASFFGRGRIFPKMGFDEFIDIQQFDEKQTFGPYISDQAVTNKILEITEQYANVKPLFIFAITMENHGPLHLEKTTTEELQHYFDKPPIDELNDLTVYLRHLENADKMILTLSKAYQQFDKPSTLCFYGDHIPSMPKIYQQIDYHDDDSDYLIWQSNQSTTKEQSLSVDSLAETLLKITGNLSN